MVRHALVGFQVSDIDYSCGYLPVFGPMSGPILSVTGHRDPYDATACH
jgi:hypothetical protein